jgi:hypothetical protein
MSRVRRICTIALSISWVASGAQARPCDVAGSRVPNCGFDSELPPWFFLATTAIWVGHGCATAPGCAQFSRSGAVLFAQALSACAPVDPLQEHLFGFSMRVVSGAPDGDCSYALHLYDDPACVIASGQVQGFFPPTAEWSHVERYFTAPASTMGARLVVQCDDPDNGFLLALDDALLVPVLFRDGFESGDFSAWTLSVP